MSIYFLEYVISGLFCNFWLNKTIILLSKITDYSSEMP